MVETSLLLYQDKKNYSDIPDIIKVWKVPTENTLKGWSNENLKATLTIFT